MLKLDIPTVKVQNEYINKFLPKLQDRIINGSHGVTLNNKIKKILLPGWDTAIPDTSVLKKLLISEPMELKKVNDELWVKIIKFYTSEKGIKTKLNTIFDYDRVFSKNKSNSYWLAKKIGRNTCTYCNRIYTITVINADRRITRPEFDHWYSHADYPLMSISLFNLIPSCNICNSSAKGSTTFTLATHIHPYVHDLCMPKIKFIAGLTDDEPPQWTVKIATTPGSKEEKTIEDFHLNEIYASHGELEVKDLMEFNVKYPNGYLKDLIDKLEIDSQGKLTRADVYRILFGTEIDVKKYIDRPLSEMKHDILEEMGVI